LTFSLLASNNSANLKILNLKKEILGVGLIISYLKINVL